MYNGVPRTPAYSVITDAVFRRNGYRDRGLFFLCDTIVHVMAMIIHMYYAGLLRSLVECVHT